KQAILVGHDWRDHIDQLSEAGNLDAIRIANQRIQHAADQECVLEIVDFFEKMWSFFAMAVDGISAARSVPDVPFVERKPKFFLRALMPAHKIAHGEGLSNLLVH